MKPETIGVVGLGLLGRGITACMVSRRMRVVAYERNDEARLAARGHIQQAIGDLVRRGGFSADLLDDWNAGYLEARALTELADCDFVIESIIEDPDAKGQVFDELEAIVSEQTPIASNTSALPISLLQASRRHPRRFVGMHWAEPCHLTRFLEIIRGAQTDDATVEATMRLGLAAGKDPALVRKDVEGFIVNRLGYAMFREAFWLLENGVADVETIDRSFRNAISVWANIAGPFRWMDLTGLPAYANVMQRLFPKLSRATEVPAAMRELVDSGALGIANGRGFYRYTADEARDWEQKLVENVWKVREMTNELFPEPPAAAAAEEKRMQHMNDREQTLEALGYPIERTTPEGELVDAVAIVDGLVYASGQVPFDGERLASAGKVPTEVTADEAFKAAALCAANVLRAVRRRVGTLDAIERVVRLTGYVNSTPEFTGQHLVINGASELVRRVFGDAGRHARTALGLAQLPLGASVEVEMILKLRN